MPKTYRTSRPEVNKLFPGERLPAIGVTLITGAALSGKTTLAMDIVRETLSTQGDEVLVLTEEERRWQKSISYPNLFLRASANPEDFLRLSLIVTDGVGVNGKVINFARTGPVLVTSNSTTVMGAFASTAQLILRVDRGDDGYSKVTVLKSRDAVQGASATYKVDEVLGIVPSDYEPPAAKSAWDRLLDEEDLV